MDATVGTPAERDQRIQENPNFVKKGKGKGRQSDGDDEMGEA